MKRNMLALPVITALVLSCASAPCGLAQEDTIVPEVANNLSSVSENSDDAEIAAAFEVFLTESNPPAFDAEAAEEAGASSFLIAVGNSYNDWQFADFGYRASFPYHGLWCGPGHGGPGEPVDTLDRTCMHHDKCYANQGYGSCSCDKALVDEINREYGKMNTGEKIKAQGIKLAMKVKTCN